MWKPCVSLPTLSLRTCHVCFFFRWPLSLSGPCPPETGSLLSSHLWGSEHSHCLSSYAPQILILCSIWAQLRVAQCKGRVLLIWGCIFSRNICHLLMLSSLSSFYALSQYPGFCLQPDNLCCFKGTFIPLVISIFLCSLIWLNMTFLVFSCHFLSLSYMIFLWKVRKILK